MVGVRNVVLDLLERASGEKARGRDCEHLLARCGEPRRYSDQVLLGNANFDDLLAQRLAERRELAAAARIAGDDDQVAVALRKTEQRLGEHIQVRPAASQPKALATCESPPRSTWTVRARSCADLRSPSSAASSSASARAILIIRRHAVVPAHDVSP